MIEAQNLTKYYGPYLAIEDVTFEVGSGEVVGFLGPNGAGKTTTMRILSGYMPASSGAATVGGYNVLTQSLEARRRIGYLPESVPLYTDMTVRAYLRFSATVRGLRGRRLDERLREILHRCRLEEYSDTLIGKLSKGYRQRVGLAQAILHEPEVLILDEPTIGIDPRQVVETRELIKDLGRERTVILSSHILPEISMLCERVIIMDQGKVVAVDHTDNLSARLHGTQRVDMVVLGPVDEVRSRLEGVKGVWRVEVRGTNDRRRYVVECEPGGDVQDQLAEAVVQGGWRLFELKSTEMSLEEIFLQLTTEE